MLSRRTFLTSVGITAIAVPLLQACGAGGAAVTVNTGTSGPAATGSATVAATSAASTTAAAASATTAAVTAASPVTSATSAVARAAGTVDLWLLGDEVWFKPMVDSFNKSQDKLTVQWEPKSDPSGQTGLVAAEAAGAPPNLVITYDEVAVGFAAKKMIQPMDTILGQLKLTPDQFQKPAIDGITWQGKLWGLPVDWDPDFMLFYNPDQFQQVGLDPDKPPTTLEDLAAAAQKLDRPNGSTYQRIGWVPWNGWGFYPMAMSFLFGGTGVYDATTQQPTLNSPSMIEGMTWVADWAKRYSPTAVAASTKGSTKAGPFGDGKLAMLSIGDWELQTLHNAAPKDFHYRIAPFPPPAAHQQDYHLSSSGWIWILPTGVHDLDATATVLGWLAADKQMVDWCQNIGWLPARTALLKDPAFQTADWTPFVNALQTLPLYPEIQPTPDAVAIETAMGKAATDILTLKNSPKEVLDAAQTALVAQIKAQG
jgi:ABC-type glycerol-3-phosphate transport system substrate-binding protein